MYTLPDIILECFEYGTPIPENNNPVNVCGDDNSDIPRFACLDADIPVDSYVILNKNNLQEISRTAAYG